MTHYLTRATLNPMAPERALLPLLDPKNKNMALDAHHRLMWTLFPGADAKRDFLWRANDKGSFLILSARKPAGSSLFKNLESKPFEPLLESGDKLSFVLRVNATKDRLAKPEEKTKPESKRKPLRQRRVDIVMHALKEKGIEGGKTGPDSRSSQRMEVAAEVAESWLANIGRRNGFAVEKLAVEDYQVRKLRRGKGKEATFGVLDLNGLLTVTGPGEFTDALTRGFGRAKAFGCGLMLVRRA